MSRVHLQRVERWPQLLRWKLNRPPSRLAFDGPDSGGRYGATAFARPGLDGAWAGEASQAKAGVAELNSPPSQARPGLDGALAGEASRAEARRSRAKAGWET